LRVPGGVRARRGGDTPACRVRQLLWWRREGVRNPATSRDRWVGREIEGGATEVQLAARQAPARPVRLPGHGAGSDRSEGGVLAGSDRAHSVRAEGWGSACLAVCVTRMPAARG